MTDPTLYPVISPRFGLPLLSVGQTQKEAFVNEAHALTDALLHCAIEGTAAAPPASPADGLAWRVAPNATGEWAGHDGQIALRQGGNWLYATARDGMQLLDRSTGQSLSFISGWRSPSAPAEPNGGTVVDSQARAAIVQLIAVLRQAGILPAN